MATTPVFLPGESHRERSLAGYSAWGHRRRTRPTDSTTTRWMLQLRALIPFTAQQSLEIKIWLL